MPLPDHARPLAEDAPAPREVARALLFDDDGRVLLVHWRDPVSGWEFWEPPGGRREEGETYVDALTRELAEETGFTGVVIGDLVAELPHRFTFAGERYDCVERYFACRLGETEAAEPRRDALEEAGIVGLRWFRIDELERIPAERLEPPGLESLVRAVRRRSDGQPGA